ncbi:MAG: hypothetical protein R3E02_02150 [Blastomonas sp.]
MMLSKLFRWPAVLLAVLVVSPAPLQAQDNGSADFVLGNQHKSAFKYSDALNAYEKAAEKGHVNAKIQAGALWCNGYGGIIASRSRAANHFQSAALTGNDNAAEHLGQLYIHGQCWGSYSRKFESASPFEMRFFEQCFEKTGNNVCRYYQGFAAYREGRWQEGIDIVKESGAAGYEDAALTLKFMSPNGPPGVQAASRPASQKPVQAAVDYSKLTVGDGWAAYEGGDYARAYQIFKYHSDRGDGDAYLGLGNMYEFGHGVGQNPGTAMRMYGNARDKGNIVGTFLYGYMIHSGQVWSSSDLKHRRIGIKFIQEAAYAGLPAAKTYLEEHAKIVARDQAQFNARLQALTKPCSDTYIRGETSDGRRYKVMRCN